MLLLTIRSQGNNNARSDVRVRVTKLQILRCGVSGHILIGSVGVCATRASPPVVGALVQETFACP